MRDRITRWVIPTHNTVVGPRRPDNELERRRPLWAALSELFLDTELQELDLRWIARVIVASGYSDREVEAILYGEVYPVLIWNLLQPIGQWGGFNAERLEERILARERRILKWPRWLQTAHWMIRKDWRKVEEFVAEARGADHRSQ